MPEIQRKRKEAKQKRNLLCEVLCWDGRKNKGLDMKDWDEDSWLLFVIGGTLSFVGMYAIDGGFGTVGGIFWAMGMIALGLLVLAGGVLEGAATS